jgi:hypothetical protein
MNPCDRALIFSYNFLILISFYQVIHDLVSSLHNMVHFAWNNRPLKRMWVTVMHRGG